MENKTYVGVRIETLNEEELKNRQHHNYRKTKNKRIVNEEGYFYYDKKTNSYKNEKSFNSPISQQRFFNRELDYKQSQNECKSLNNNFHSKRTKTISEGVLYFSNGINEDFKKNKNLFFKKVDNFRKDFEKKYNTKILDFVIHTDEEGNIHSHFIFKNYDLKNGKSLNFTKNKKNGSELQTLRGKHFEDFERGYERGEIKEKPTKHLSVEEYKLYKDTQKENRELRKENERLLKENQELKIFNNEIKNDNEKLLKSIDKNILEHYEDMKDFYNDLVNLLEEENELKFFKNLERYFKGRRKTQLKKHINKMEGKLKNIQKKKEKQNISISTNLEEESLKIQ